MSVELAKKWTHVKARLDESKKELLSIEKAIIDGGVNLKPDGANSYLEVLTITTGYDRKFDQDGLTLLYDQEVTPFPFKVVFKEDRANSKALEEMGKAFWNDYFEPLLTIKPKKPSFKVR